MKKAILRFLLSGLVALIIVGVLTYMVLDKPVPNGTQGIEAEELADEMLQALNKPAFDSLITIAFTYTVGSREEHAYDWNCKQNSVNVRWGEHDIYLDLNRKVEEFNVLEYQAYQYFINDSFWLIAPFKVRDEGVIRSLVDTSEGRGLLVRYTTGGITPGDSYLWVIDDKGFPVAWRLWTSNIPIGGQETSWGGWVEKQGVWFSKFHASRFLDIEVKNLKVNF